MQVLSTPLGGGPPVVDSPIIHPVFEHCPCGERALGKIPSLFFISEFRFSVRINSCIFLEVRFFQFLSSGQNGDLFLLLRLW